MTRVREVRAEDRDAWLAMRRRLWPDGAEDHAGEIDEFFARRAEGEVAVFVAERDGALVGFAEYALRPFAEGCESRPVGYLEGWFVEQAVRREGVGGALVRAGEEWARGLGCRELASDTEVDNDTSIAAHGRLGFRDAGRFVAFSKKL